MVSLGGVLPIFQILLPNFSPYYKFRLQIAALRITDRFHFYTKLRQRLRILESGFLHVAGASLLTPNCDCSFGLQISALRIADALQLSPNRTLYTTVLELYASYKLYWSVDSTGRGRVSLMVNVNLVKKVIDVKRLNSRIIVMEFAVDNEMITILSVYAPQSGWSIEENDLFYENLSREMLKVNGKCVILGDFNGHEGKTKMGTKEFMEALVMKSKI